MLIDVQLHEVENPCGSNFRVLIDLCSDFPKDDQSESFQIASDFVDLKLNDLYSQVSTLSVSVREHQPKFLEYVVTLNRLFEWNVGNLLHSRSFRELIGIILRLLVASSSVIEGSVTGDTFTGNGIHPIIGHLLRTLLTLLTKFQKRGFLETLGTSEWKDIYMSAARITAREPFVNEHRVIGGIVMAHAIHFTGYSDWKNALFSHHEIQLVSSAPSVYLESETSELCDFGRLCLLRGIFHVYAAEDPFFDQLVSSDCTKEQHLFMVLHEKVSLIARNARKSFERMLAYDALSDSFARVSHLSNSSTTAFRAEINHTLLIIINNWEDPVDTLEHKLRDLFITVLGLIVKDTELLDSLFSRLTSMNAHEKVRFDLLSIVASKIGLPTVLRLSPTVFHDALNLLPYVVSC